MTKSTETTAQSAVKIPDRVWRVVVPVVAYAIYLGTQFHTMAERQTAFDENLAEVLKVQYTYAIDINTLEVTMASYESLGDMAGRIENLLEQLEDGT